MNLFAPPERALNTLFPQHAFLDDYLYVTKSRNIAATYKLNGVDFECLTDEMLDSITRHIHGVLKGLDANFRIYQYVVKRKGCNVAYHRASELFDIRVFWVLLYEKRTGALASHSISDQLAAIRPALASFESLMAPIAPVQRTDYQATFAFIQELTQSEGELKYCDHLDYWTAQSPITVNHKRLYIGTREVTPLTLTRLPPSTEPNMLGQLLRLPCELILCSEFKKRAHDKAAKIVHDSKKHNRSREDNPDSSPAALAKAGREEAKKKQGSGLKDEAATENLAYLGNAVVRLSNYEFMGEFMFRVMLLDAPEKATDAINIAVNMGAEMEVDTYGALNSYLSIIPGNTKRNSLKHWILSENYADMALCWAPPAGNAINPQFGKEYQILLETSLQTPYFFNHHQRYDESPDGICIGAKGSGKSVWANLQAHHLLSKYDPWVLILDGQGGSFRSLTEYHDGRYYDLSVDGKWPFTLNPTHLPDSSLTRQHLSMLIRTCCVVGGFVPDAEKNQIIYDETCRVMGLPKDQRRLSALQLPKSIALYLSPWVGNGQYSFVFDNGQDTFALNRLQTIDFSAINSYPDVLQPLLFHFFHLWDRVIDNDSLLAFPKQMIFDEAWKLLNFQAAREYMEKAGRTWRKRNGMSLFLSQSIVELKRAGMLDLVQELFQQKFLFANSTASFSMYASELDLNGKVLEQFKTLRGKGDFLFISPYGANKLHTNLTALERFLFAKSPTEDAKRTAAIAEHGFSGALCQLAKRETAA